MKKLRSFLIFFSLANVMWTNAAPAATVNEAKAAIAKAETAEAAAGSVNNQWTVTEDQLAAARKALAAANYDAAVSSATFAAELAQRSIEQAKEQDAIWLDAVIK